MLVGTGRNTNVTWNSIIYSNPSIKHSCKQQLWKHVDKSIFMIRCKHTEETQLKSFNYIIKMNSSGQITNDKCEKHSSRFFILNYMCKCLLCARMLIDGKHV